MMKLEGKVALVTGSSRGIGQAVAVRLAREGADVAVNYSRSAEGAEQTAAAVKAAGRRAAIFQADLGKADDARALVNRAAQHFGRLDVLVNNAGLERHAPFWEVSEEDYDRVVNVNLKGAFFAAQALTRYLMEHRRPGKIINMSSVHEELPFPNFAAYCAAKGGLRMLTRTLAVELGPFGITVNGIAPGAVETDINEDLLKDPEKRQALLDQIPLKRLASPQDVAGLAVFLASSDADYVTGATYFVDGGLTWHYQEQ